MTMPSWICCQVGAREHYSIPRALQRIDQLETLITEIWAGPQSWIRYSPVHRWRERYSPELDSSIVRSWNFETARFESWRRVSRSRGWPLLLERNRWFQSNAVRFLRAARSLNKNQPRVV